MGWVSEVNEFLEQQNYQLIANFYEQEIDKNPQNIKNYIYLVLAYLLSGKESEAEAICFSLMTEESEEYLLLLNQLLDQEAERQTQHHNYENSYKIRSLIKEINEQDINNLLLITELAIKLTIINNDYLDNLFPQIILENFNQAIINWDILYRVLNQLLDFNFHFNVNFIQLLLKIYPNNQKLINLTLNKVEQIGRRQDKLQYGLDLMKICYGSLPDNLELINEIYIYHILLKQFEDGATFASKIIEKSLDNLSKLYGYSCLIDANLYQGNYRSSDDYFRLYLKYLNEITEQELKYRENFVREYLLRICKHLFYWNDSPEQNRAIINKFASLFQDEWNKQYPWQRSRQKPNQRAKTEKLNIGYIAHNLGMNCIGILSRWLIYYLDRDQFNIYIYVIEDIKDEINERWFQKNITKFTHCPHNPEQICREIDSDQIDILVDLDCFTGQITQIVMALKPAPIQISWLGLDSTGIPAIDYFIVDPYVVPKDGSKYYKEQLWCLPQTYIAVDGFEVSSPSLRREDLDIPADSVIYMSLQTGFKRNPDNLRLQMKILREVKDSYFIVSGGNNETMRKNISELFNQIAKEEGVNPNRIKILPFMPVNTYRANLILGDIVLDTYPFNGATTTLDALWLNIPLVTKVGQQFHARQGYTFLTNLGIREGIAWTDEEYVQWGVRFGRDENLRKEISWKLKQSKKTSPLWNGKQFAREMEKAYQQMWQIYFNS